jgi:hypothetical protein
MQHPDQGGRPSALIWLAAAVSLLLPILGVGAALFGLYLGASGGPAGWYWVGAGIVLIVADMVIDRIWAHPRVSRSDMPDLNRRGAELVGQKVLVVEAIAPGSRGAVRAADTVWSAEGCEAAPGTRVRISGVKGTVLIVEPA